MSTNRVYPDKPKAVYFYGTCLVDLYYPNAGLAGMQLIEREGVEVHYPQAQSCCGQPAFNSGYWDEAREVARSQLALFEEDWPIVLPSASCAAMMRHHYPELFAGDPQAAQAKSVADRVYELSEFLTQVLRIELKDRGEPLKVALHTSCHGLREMQVAEDGQALINQLANITLVPLQRQRECCGFGGTFAVKQPEISAAMVADKVADIHDSGVDQLISGDCGCLMNITGAMQKKHQATTGKHLAEFLWERTHA